MDVRCPQCQTLYELDDEQVHGRPVTLKCSQCQHVFRLDSSMKVGENVRRWMIRRQREGDIIYLDTLDTLQDRILKQEVERADEVSRTGKKWVALGTIPEFGPMFQVVDSISQMEGSSAVSSIATRMPPQSPTAPAAKPPPAPSEPPRERVKTAVQYGQTAPQRTEDITKRVGPTGPAPPVEAAASTPAPSSSEPSGSLGEESSWGMGDDVVVPHPPVVPTPSASRSSGAPWGIIAFVVLAAGVAGAFVVSSDGGDETKTKGAVSLAPEKKVVAPPIDPHEAVRHAMARALAAARAENDAVWTLWHEAASTPFYVALDTAYTEADAASVVVEHDERLRQGRLALENGRAKEASRIFMELLARKPNDAEAITGLGWTRLAEGQSREAAAFFAEAIEKDPTVGDAYIGLGTAHRQLGDLQSAFDAYDRYLGRFPRGEKASIAAYQMERLRKQLGK